MVGKPSPSKHAVCARILGPEEQEKESMMGV